MLERALDLGGPQLELLPVSAVSAFRLRLAQRGSGRGLARASLGALLALAASCAIGGNDLLPAMGAPCQTHEATCDIEHVCRPPGAPPDGVCAPVMSYGACDQIDGPPSHAPGRLGELKDAERVTIASVAELEQLRAVRLVTGTVEVFEQGAGDALVGTLCPLRTLQVVGDGLAIGDSDLVNLDGLQSLTSVVRGLAIFNNQRLTSLAGLENLVEVSPREVDNLGSFHVLISGNPVLPEAEVTAFEQRLQEKNGGGLRIVSCSNAADDCVGGEAQLLNYLIANGVRP